jgi:ABC-type transport system involved in multi-copper enzyme maturation permease subunit
MSYTPGSDRLARALHAEWTKFRTVRGWVAGVIIAVLLTAGIALLDHSQCGGTQTPGGPVITGAGCPAPPLGPGGEAVTDSFYFVRQPLAGNGGLTARVTSLTSPAYQAQAGAAGLQPWAKAGIMIAASTRPGSAYAAMMVTRGHGVRMQYDYTGDVAGLPGAVSATAPRWLRLTRNGDTVTGYDSADGTHWTEVGAVQLAGLPATAQVGLFAASPAGETGTTSSQPVSGSSSGSAATPATATFDHISLRGRHPGGAWAGDAVGGPAPGTGFRQAGGTVTVKGSGDIAPFVPASAGGGGGFSAETTLAGTFGGLLAVIVVATLFMTAEYRRGLIRVTFTATPGRVRVLAAKALVIGSVTFVAGLAGAGAAIPLGERLLRANGNYIMPVGTLTEIRLVMGTAALLAVAAVLACALGAILRHGAGTVAVVVMLIVVPYFASLFSVLPAGAADWMLRVTPAAAFSIQQTMPQYSQVTADYTPGNGYFPLAPWAGFAVLCLYAALAVALAAVRLRRTDA